MDGVMVITNRIVEHMDIFPIGIDSDAIMKRELSRHIGEYIFDIFDAMPIKYEKKQLRNGSFEFTSELIVISKERVTELVRIEAMVERMKAE